MKQEGTHFRKVDVRIWNDEKFLSLTEEGAFVFLFLLTHPDLRPFGVLKSSMEGLASEFPFFPRERYAKGFRELLKKGLIQQSVNRCFIRLKNFLKYNPPDNKNVLISWLKSVDYLPECDERNQLLCDLKPYAERFGIPLDIGFPKPYGDSLSTEQGALKEKRTPISPKISKPEMTSLPPWLDPSVWNDFREHRKKIRKPMTPVAEKKILGELDRLRSLGQDPATILNRSIMNGWTGVFEIKDIGPSGRKDESVSEHNRRVGEAWLAKHSAFDATKEVKSGKG